MRKTLLAASAAMWLGACLGTEDTDDPAPLTLTPGDCTVQVPENAQVIADSGVSNTIDDIALVCAGANYVSNSSGGIFFVREGANLSANSGDTWVWAQGDALISAGGDGLRLTHEPDVTISGRGSEAADLSECTTITLDLSLLGDRGC